MNLRQRLLTLPQSELLDLTEALYVQIERAARSLRSAELRNRPLVAMLLQEIEATIAESPGGADSGPSEVLGIVKIHYHGGPLGGSTETKLRAGIPIGRRYIRLLAPDGDRHLYESQEVMTGDETEIDAFLVPHALAIPRDAQPETTTPEA